MDHLRKLLPIVICCCLASIPHVYARTAANILQGRVVDGKGEGVPAARVFIQSADGSSPHTFRADAQGRFSRKLLRIGLYDVRAEAGGLWSEWQHNVKPGLREDVVLTLARTTPPEKPR
jgi:hypothetical protein